jgi:hypothetical protein
LSFADAPVYPKISATELTPLAQRRLFIVSPSALIELNNKIYGAYAGIKQSNTPRSRSLRRPFRLIPAGAYIPSFSFGNVHVSAAKLFKLLRVALLVAILIPTFSARSCDDDDGDGGSYGGAPPSSNTQDYNDFWDEQYKDTSM